GDGDDAAYELGRGEVRDGRSMDALLSAYRVGARVAWRCLAAGAVPAGLPAAEVAKFAELTFAYIDELSAASAAGHADELAARGRAHERHLEHLAR
ncbi:PucR family transcriptional regulator, partial [Streptomyces sp. SID7982]|nr:PucR family transcriptional regulator [Streptomyces sp. SID7982]